MLDLNKIATEIYEKILKRFGDEIRVEIEIKDFKGEEISKGYFKGYTLYPERTHIHVETYDLNLLPKGKRNFREWKADFIVTFVHEYSHYWMFKNMSKEEQRMSNNFYSKNGFYSEIEESLAWKSTVKFLKRLGYWRNSAVRETLNRFSGINDKIWMR